VNSGKTTTMPSGLDSFRWRRDAPLRAGPLVRRRPFRVCFVPSTDKRPSGDGRLSTVKSVHSSVTTRTFDGAVFLRVPRLPTRIYPNPCVPDESDNTECPAPEFGYSKQKSSHDDTIIFRQQLRGRRARIFSKLSRHTSRTLPSTVLLAVEATSGRH